VTRLLRNVQIPAQANADDDSHRGATLENPRETDHDHAWRRSPAPRGSSVVEYRCDLCELSFLE
jgi:hypothetical protein